MLQTFLQSEIGEVVGAEFVAQEDGELFVLLEEAVLPISAEDVMTMLDLFQGGVQLAAEPARLPLGGRSKPPARAGKGPER